jgi:hypothetical protein
MEKQILKPAIVYVLSILGLLCCCIGGLGFIFSGIAAYIAHSKLKQVEENPENYDHDSVKAMNTAKIVAMSTLIINILYFGMTIYRISTIGWDELMKQSETMMEEWGNQ